MLNWKVYREKYFGYEIGTAIGILIRQDQILTDLLLCILHFLFLLYFSNFLLNPINAIIIESYVSL